MNAEYDGSSEEEGGSDYYATAAVKPRPRPRKISGGTSGAGGGLGSVSSTSHSSHPNSNRKAGGVFGMSRIVR